MKKSIAILIIVSMLFWLTACADTKVINGIEYDTYGFINKSGKRNPEIKYRLVIGNIVWAIILSETIVAPIYFFGFSIYEPVGNKDLNAPKGSI